MPYRQMHIEMGPEVKGLYMNHTIWQPQTTCKPWAIHLEGDVRYPIDVRVYHEDLGRDGCIVYRGINVSRKKPFLDFMIKQMMTLASFKKNNMEFRALDAIALSAGYERGIALARRF